MPQSITRKELITALEWYVDHGVDEPIFDAVNDRAVSPKVSPQRVLSPTHAVLETSEPIHTTFLGKSDAYEEALKLAQSAKSLDDLRKAIQDFDGIALKKTATNMVFADGNPKAKIMLVGEAPGADEDRLGKPFVGVSGQLLDKILKCINLDRSAEKPEESVYISNVLNWRPPGNRTPSPGEIEVSLPFIERHIQLIQPKILILFGGVAAQSLLNSASNISRLRKIWHDYKPQTSNVGDYSCPTVATYHPSYLLRTPLQKKAVWADMLMIQKKKSEK
ncbi:MAG: uracil-DNA glycosylase [Alphaproteobacteria bacterium]|nr:uracil-DNA glycosylase [Alphaproteobacteria bacterium]